MASEDTPTSTGTDQGTGEGTSAPTDGPPEQPVAKKAARKRAPRKATAAVAAPEPSGTPDTAELPTAESAPASAPVGTDGPPAPRKRATRSRKSAAPTTAVDEATATGPTGTTVPTGAAVPTGATEATEPTEATPATKAPDATEARPVRAKKAATKRAAKTTTRSRRATSAVETPAPADPSLVDEDVLGVDAQAASTPVVETGIASLPAPDVTAEDDTDEADEADETDETERADEEVAEHADHGDANDTDEAESDEHVGAEEHVAVNGFALNGFAVNGHGTNGYDTVGNGHDEAERLVSLVANGEPLNHELVGVSAQDVGEPAHEQVLTSRGAGSLVSLAVAPSLRSALDRGTAAPKSEEDDGLTPIFRSLQSNWLSSTGSDAPWSSSEVDAGWDAADRVEATPPTRRTETGLPMRRPGNRLIPGGLSPVAAPTVRDPEAIRARLAAHAAGVSRGRTAAVHPTEPTTEEAGQA
ncbi:MAG: hypothetical protein ABIW80_01485 [Lapillicoccus sp.]